MIKNRIYNISAELDMNLVYKGHHKLSYNLLQENNNYLENDRCFQFITRYFYKYCGHFTRNFLKYLKKRFII